MGCGAYLVVNENEGFGTELKEKIKIKKFNNTTSTKLELQTLLWALSELENIFQKVVIYTDSQNIMGLARRRSSLEKNEYHSEKGKILSNHELYREFFKRTDQMNCAFVKVDGHQTNKNKNEYDQLFTIVDRAARKAVRSF